jgi:hypothetical protein
MLFAPIPSEAAWRHHEARDGFEVVFFETVESGLRLVGHTAAVEDRHAWSVRYDLTVDANRCTRRARVRSTTEPIVRDVTLEADASGQWRVNGAVRAELAGCLDVDLEASACTNMLPVHRMPLEVGEQADAPASYVRALDLSVERLEQHYERIADEGSRRRYRYRAPAFDVECVLVYDESGLVVEYPGLASRVL